MLRQGHFEARRLIGGVRPPILDESGVVPAIAHLVHEASSQKGPQIEYHAKVEFDRLAPILENAIYRVSQEALANACNHSKSPKVRVSLRQHGEQLRLEVRDWGIGFAPEKVRDGSYGLEGIRQRVRLLGGKCSVRSTPGAGTRVTIELPLARGSSIRRAGCFGPQGDSASRNCRTSASHWGTTSQRKATISRVMTTTITVSTIFHRRENCPLRHNIGKASGPRVRKSMAKTPQTLSNRGGRRPGGGGGAATGSLGSKIASAVAAPH